MNRRKIISLVTVLVMIFNIVLPNFAFALEAGKAEIKVVASKTEVKRGDEIKVSVNLNTNSLEDISAIQLYMYYDKDVLEPVGTPTRDLPIQGTGAFNDVGGADINNEDGYVSFFWGSDSVQLNYNGSLCTATFKVKENATIGSTELVIRDEEMGRTDINTGEVIYTPCTVENSSVNVILPIDSIALDKTTSELWVGENDTLTVTYNPEDATGKEITWTSSDEKVAIVEDGTVTAVGRGTATITATTSNGKTDTCAVTVKQPITGITLDKTSLELEKGSTEKLTTTILPENADGDKTVTWTSSNENIATVSTDGTVTAVGRGTATITATTSNGKTDTCVVTVGVPLKSISLTDEEGKDIAEKTLNRSETLNLNVVFNPEDTDTDKTITWSSSNTAIATVSTDGTVTAVDKGNATITATTVNGKKAICDIKVVVPLNSITIKDTTSIKYGQTEKLEVTFDPVDTTDDTTIIWSSSDEDIATVSTDGTVTAKAVGTATIIAKTVTGKTDTCDVTVLPVPLDSIDIKEQNITINKGLSKDLTIIYTPEDTTDSKDVVWKSSDETVVTVENGKITAVGRGTATITATVGEKTTTTEVTVKVPLENITLNETKVTLNRPQTINLNVTLNPDDTTADPTETWTSSDTSVATVNQNGIVTPVAPGTTYIKVKVEDKEATCEVTVKVPLEGISIKSETELLKGQYEKLVVTNDPKDTTYEGTITWKSSDEEIATVDENGKVTALKEGTVIITATAEENGNIFTSNCEVKVKEIKTDSIVVDTTDFDLGIGRTKQLKVNFYPEDTTDDKVITWKSSNTEVATVDENGKVTALKEGTAVIIATTADGKTATVEITVKEIPIESIEIEVSKTVKVGETFKAVVRVNPSDATKQDALTISSSNNDIIAVGKNGELTAKSAGTAIITVEAENGVKNQVEITVQNIDVVTGTNDVNAEGQTNTAISSSPKTGDIAIELFVGLMIISALGIAFILIKNKRK